MKHDFGANDRVSLELNAAGVAHVRLVRSDKLNALDPSMMDALVSVGHVLSGEPGLRAVVLSGEGRAFCAGLDLSSMEALAGGDMTDLTERAYGNANLYQQLAVQWRKLPVPVIAAIHGACFGGGLQIAAGADIRVAAPDARLAVMEMKWGIVPDMGGFALWQGCVRADVLRELTYTNREFSGEEALAWGFATIVDANPLARANAIAAEIALRSPHAVRAAKSLFNRSADLPFDEVLIAETIEQHKLLGSRNQMEAVHSQMAGRAAEFTDP
jgi:enoyl-CoA hydratase/carnithine racemase